MVVLNIKSIDIWYDRFRPERWLNLPKTYNPTFSLLSFIAGPHGCIGKTMAIIEMKAVLASVTAHSYYRGLFDLKIL